MSTTVLAVQRDVSPSLAPPTNRRMTNNTAQIQRTRPRQPAPTCAVSATRGVQRQAIRTTNVTKRRKTKAPGAASAAASSSNHAHPQPRRKKIVSEEKKHNAPPTVHVLKSSAIPMDDTKHSEMTSKAALAELNAKFLTMPREAQMQAIGLVDEAVVQELVASNQTIVYVQDLWVPDGVRIERISVPFNGHRLVATRDFAAGETVFVNTSKMIPVGHSVIYKVPTSVNRLWLVDIEHSVNRGEAVREYFGFDTFQNHHCEPNTQMIYVNGTQYKQVALRDIKAGDEINGDYEEFDSMADGTIFICQCGSAKCRREIHG